ncbi:MAG: carboxypeptidase-like regulatory domain-containing protein [Spirochaetota bacterium]
MLRQALRLIAIISFTVIMCSCMLSAFSLALNQGIIEGSAPVGSQGNYAAADYFNTTPGYGVEYHITDSYSGGLDATVWAVNQSVAAAPPDTDRDFFTTIVADTVTTGSFPSSALSGSEEVNTPSGTFHWYNSGMRVRNQANFYRMAMLPSQFSVPESWSYDKGDDGRFFYSLNYTTDQTFGGSTFTNCIRVEIQNDNAVNTYMEGRGYYIYSLGAGLIKLHFNRPSDFTQVDFEIISSHPYPSPYQVSGTVEDSGGNPLPGLEVQLAWRDFGLGSTTDATGAFTAEAYGPDMQLYIGEDNDSNGDLDDNQPDANYPYEPIITNLTGNRTGLVVTAP